MKGVISSQKRVLFVCSILGARSCIASHFCNLFSEGAVESVAAGFQKGSFSLKITTFTEAKGIHLPAQSPRDVFSLHRDGACFDYLVTLCDDGAREQCPIFRRTVGTLFTAPVLLHWHIPDFQSIEGGEDFISSCWEQIVADIEGHVRYLVREILSPRQQNLGSTHPNG